jgi:capsular polysaccharide biosynthesis protein
MAVLMREVESAQRIYDSALLRFGQTNMEGQSSQTDVSILNPAIPPIKHSSPNITLNIILSMFLGSLLALGFAIAAEMLDRRVRTHEDLEQLLDLPVLHVISESNRSSTRVVSFLRQLLSKNKTNKNAGSRYQFL